MKHASNQSLSPIKSLLNTIRKFKELKEKKLGIFYKGSIAFLHFHEDPKGLFADLKIANKWKRFRVNTQAEQKILLKRIIFVICPKS